MESGQEKFLSYILECVQEGKEEEAKKLLMKCFELQKENRFSSQYLQKFNEDIVKILKAERKDEVIAILNQFGNSHING